MKENNAHVKGPIKTNISVFAVGEGKMCSRKCSLLLEISRNNAMDYEKAIGNLKACGRQRGDTVKSLRGLPGSTVQESTARCNRKVSASGLFGCKQKKFI